MGNMDKHIYLIGFMGVGKTSTSRELVRLLGVEEVEMDARIVAENGMSINDMFALFGEEYFRDRETDMIAKIASEAPAVVSCGGGAVLRPTNVELMKKSGVIVLLTAEPQTVFGRVKDATDRPILNGHMNVDYIAGLMEKRRAIYESVCDVRIATDGKTPRQVASEIVPLCSQ